MPLKIKSNHVDDMFTVLPGLYECAVESWECYKIFNLEKEMNYGWDFQDIQVTCKTTIYNEPTLTRCYLTTINYNSNHSYSIKKGIICWLQHWKRYT